MQGTGIKSCVAILAAIIVMTPTSICCQDRSMLDFNGTIFTESIDSAFWRKSDLNGIDVVGDQNKVRFATPVDFRRATFQYPANFMGASFSFPADFDGVAFSSKVFFWGSTFDSAAYLGKALFNSEANFIEATFKSAVDFRRSSFNSITYFYEAIFNSNANFLSADFNSEVDFRKSFFDSIAHFGVATFDSTANFGAATFNSKVNFSSATFNSSVAFEKAIFDSTVVFDGVRFGSSADFRWVEFRDKVHFAPLALPEKLDMRDMNQIAYPIDMTYAGRPRNGGRCKIALTKADLSKIWITMELFEIYFPVDTIQDGDSVCYASACYDDQLAVYENLLEQFNERGLMDSYEILDKEYRQFVNSNQGFVYKFIIDPFQSVWWSYGYNPEYVFVWTGFGWLFFSLINLFLYRRLKEEVYMVSFLGPKKMIVFRRPRTWIRYFLQVMTYTAVVFFALKMSLDKFRKGVIKKHPFLFSYLMIVYISGLLCIGFIANIVFT